MNYRLLILFILLTGSIGVCAQKDSDMDKRIYVGGNFGIQFSTYYTVVDVSPLVGYKITDRFSAGVGGTYIYYRIKDPFYNKTFKTDIYGGSLFSRYFIYENIFAHAEFEELSLEDYDFATDKVHRFLVPMLFVGGGFIQPIGEYGFAQLLLLYDINQDIHSPYQNPVLRVGFGFAL